MSLWLFTCGFMWMYTFSWSTVLPILQMKKWDMARVSNSSKITWPVNALGLNSVLPCAGGSYSLPSSLPQGGQQLPASQVSQEPLRRTPIGKVSVGAEDELSPIVGGDWSLDTIAKEGWSPLRGWRNLCGAFKTRRALPSWEWGLAQGCQIAGLLLHLVSKWYERGQAELWTSLFHLIPGPTPATPFCFSGPASPRRTS